MVSHALFLDRQSRINLIALRQLNINFRRSDIPCKKVAVYSMRKLPCLRDM